MPSCADSTHARRLRIMGHPGGAMITGIAAGPLGGAPTSDEIDLGESVAGEEDPGASIDMAAEPTPPGKSDQPAGQGRSEPTFPAKTMAPGDEAPPGTPGTGEDVCPDCGGTGQKAGGTCPTCLGTGKVTVGIGGA
jgi:hypothetical protein